MTRAPNTEDCSTHWLLRAPDHLGDAVMAEPAIAALCEQYSCSIIGPSFCAELYAHLPTVEKSTNKIVLFKPSTAEAIRCLHYTRRVGLGRRWLLSDSIAPRPGHRIENLNRVAQHLGAHPQRPPHFPASGETPPLPQSFALFIVGTASPETVLWDNYDELADAVNIDVVFAGGPGDETIVESMSKGHRLPTTLSLSSFASIARKASWVVGSDCGLMHLACAARPDSNRHFVIIGSTNPDETAPTNAQAIMGAQPQCWPCYRKQCNQNRQCLQIPTELVLKRINQCL